MNTLPSLLLLALAAVAPASAASAVATAGGAPPAVAAPTRAAPARAAPSPSALAAEFGRIDTNEDGRVSSSEHEVYTRLLFDAMDADVDYKLTVAEIMASPDRFFRHVTAGAGGMFGTAELTPAEKIQRIDANRDGVVSRDEHANAAAAKFREMDVNNNGELSPGEFAAGG